jgi:hypothetical protein
MKILMTIDSIISLENVRRVEKRVRESTHTTYGKKYTITNYSIAIIYTDDKSEHISCGEGKNGADMCEATFANIYDILAKE